VDIKINQNVTRKVKNKVGSSALMMASGYPNVFKKLKEAGAEK
jgi:hypothetical protein